MTKRRPIPPSDAQLNAERLAMRAAPYSQSHAASVEFSWDYRAHIPDDLRGLVRAARRAYEDEVPTKLHEGPDSIGPDGTPKWNAQGEGYIFGRPDADDTRHKCDCGDKLHPPDATHPDYWHDHTPTCAVNLPRPIASYHLTPFRATLDRMEKGDVHQRRDAAIVRHITIGGMEPGHAAMTEQSHPLDSRRIAEIALRSFFARYSDVKLDLHREPNAA